jgi:hypothetical protein
MNFLPYGRGPRIAETWATFPGDVVVVATLWKEQARALKSEIA